MADPTEPTSAETPDPAALYVTQGDIADRLHLSRERVRQIVASKGFPDPAGRFGNVPVWSRDAVAAWAHQTGRDW